MHALICVGNEDDLHFMPILQIPIQIKFCAADLFFMVKFTLCDFQKD